MGVSQRYFYPEARFGGFTRDDGTVAFYNRVQAASLVGHSVLDVGCGRGLACEDPVAYRRAIRTLKRPDNQVLGIDVDSAGKTNPLLDEFRMIEGPRWPVDDGSIDLLVADYVLEHIEDVPAFFAEIRRVLKGTGVACLRTTNGWGYVALAARLIPNRHHAGVLKRVQQDREAEDVFPTYYRCNTIGSIRRQFAAIGFDHGVWGHAYEPAYMEFSKIAYAMGVLYTRWAPAAIQPMLFAFGSPHAV